MALLCTNVVGDSLALDRQIFTQGMADWLATTARHFARSSQAQLVVRVHPGEMLGAGHPSVDIVRDALPHLPPQVILVPPKSEINTYDLIELAHVGMVYTTTVGLEMAMFGVPAIVCGATHYRGKGFTDDPGSLGGYSGSADPTPAGAARTASARRIRSGWLGAMPTGSSSSIPLPSPGICSRSGRTWPHCPLEKLAASELAPEYQRTLRALAGEPVDWRLEVVAQEATA